MLIRSTVRDGHVGSLLGFPFGIIGQYVLKGLSGRNRLVSGRRQAPGRNAPMACRLVRCNENRRPHFMVSLTCLPAGITVEGATPPRRVLIVRHCVRRLTSSRAAPADKKGGRSLHHHPSRVARRERRGHVGRSPATFVVADAGNPFQPASNTAFQVKPPPQRQGRRPLRVERCGCQTRAPPACATPPL